MTRTVLVLLGLALSASLAHAADWLQFRGPGGLAISEEKGLPSKWTATENVLWKLELPGPGTSSPIVIGDRIYLTCYSGYALDQKEPGDQKNLLRHVVCVDRKTGKLAWSKEFKPELPESNYGPGNDGWHGYASSTPVSDGKHLFVFFGRSGVYCLDLEGNQVWQAGVGTRTNGWGSGNSPVLHENLVIVNASVESNTMFALDKTSGKEVWKTEKMSGCRSTPILVKTADAKMELVVNQPEAVVGYDPATGKELWRAEGIPDKGYVCPSPVAHDGVVYVIGGRKNTAIAVRAGGRGNVNETHVLWRSDAGSNVSSPVFYEGNLYWVHERQGLANCLNGKTGEKIYQERLEPRPGVVYSSILAADGKLYCLSQHNGVYVLAAGPKFQLLSVNPLDDARLNASPAVVDGQLLIRNDKHLYCIGGK